MCGGDKYFSAIPYSTYNPSRKLLWLLNLSWSFSSSSATGTKGCLDLSSHCCVVSVNRSRSWRRCSGSTARRARSWRNMHYKPVCVIRIVIKQFWKLRPGAAPRGDWGERSPQLLTKVIFVNRLKPMRKYWGYEGWRHQPYLNYSLSLLPVVFKNRI